MARRYKPTLIEKIPPDVELGEGSSGGPPPATPAPSGPPPAAPPVAVGSAEYSAQPEGIQADCEHFRPSARPPMAVLHLFDDGSRTTGESFRLRAEQTVIGRTDGDILISHDSAISSRHAEIVREFNGGKYCWILRDLGSRNGTFVRVARTILKRDQEFILGSRRYMYRPPRQQTAATAPTAPPDRHVTQGWQTLTPEQLNDQCPTLVQQLATGEAGTVFTLVGNEIKLGSSESACTHPITDDPYVSSIHAKITRDGARCKLTDEGSLNGVWLRVKSVPLDNVCEFQIGEQRFRFRL